MLVGKIAISDKAIGLIIDFSPKPFSLVTVKIQERILLNHHCRRGFYNLQILVASVDQVDQGINPYLLTFLQNLHAKLKDRI